MEEKPNWLVPSASQQVPVTAPVVLLESVANTQKPGTLTPTPSEVADSPADSHIVGDGIQTPDFGGFKPSQISFLVAAFTPLFEDNDAGKLKPKHLEAVDRLEHTWCMLLDVCLTARNPTSCRSAVA